MENQEKIEEGKRKMEREKSKNLLLVFFKDKLGVKKSVLVRATPANSKKRVGV